ncbi:hypothetical protein [Methylobacterium sp. A54F]
MPSLLQATAAADTGRRAFLSAVPTLLALPMDLVSKQPDPVFRAISVARHARDEFTAALEALDEAERDKALLRAADEAAERDTDARQALAATKPTTREGLHALIRHHADDVGILEPTTTGALALRELAGALPPPVEPRRPKRHRLLRYALIAGEAVLVAFVCGGGAALANLPHLL